MFKFIKLFKTVKLKIIIKIWDYNNERNLKICQVWLLVIQKSNDISIELKDKSVIFKSSVI